MNAMSNEEKLDELQLPALKERRNEGYMNMLSNLSQQSSQGTLQNLCKKELKEVVRKFSFPERAID